MNDLNETLNLNLQVKSIARLLDALGYPSPDDADGDWGPIGPVVRGLTWAALNPQPLPPRWVVEIIKQFGPHPDPWKEKQGPHPEPWKGALLARFEIDRLVGLARTVEAIDGDRGQDGIRRQLAEIIDEWCGTPPRPRWPLPWPFPFRLQDEKFTIGPVDLVMMGVQFHQAAEALHETPLAQDFSAAANRLTQTGLQRLETYQPQVEKSKQVSA
ncbi:MAG: hypothetical protein ND895_23590 [Pyrinomonadaceae bacterium]|nr:hypothetical protein [Pyrinomonadaceae bacterium]